MTSIPWPSVALLLALGVVPVPAVAQDGDRPAAPPAAAGVIASQDDDPDLDVNRAQPDFTLVGLPTTLRLPARKGAFRITHRFARPLGQGDVGDLLEDFFGFDSGAQIGFEYRYGLFRATQLAVHRTSDRTIQFLLQRQVVGQGEDFPIAIDAVGTIEGANNLKDSYSPALGVVLSHEFSDRAAVYAEPIWVHNTTPLPDEVADDDSTVMVGLGARLRLTSSLYGVVEVTPRLTGYDPSESLLAFAVEKRIGGHSFQINIGNGFGTTFAQIARGGFDDWFIGFNLTRKFY
ncbi:MAG: DUF5777 family beta-barrel protein [Vicinamibacterales bacterium]